MKKRQHVHAEHREWLSRGIGRESRILFMWLPSQSSLMRHSAISAQYRRWISTMGSRETAGSSVLWLVYSVLIYHAKVSLGCLSLSSHIRSSTGRLNRGTGRCIVTCCASGTAISARLSVFLTFLPQKKSQADALPCTHPWAERSVLRPVSQCDESWRLF